MIFKVENWCKINILAVSILTGQILVLNPGQMGLTQESSLQTSVIRPGDNLKIEGIPPIPITLADKVRKYTEARGATALDWHPTERAMLISTRFANSNQVHRVLKPGGARYQLTFFIVRNCFD